MTVTMACGAADDGAGAGDAASDAPVVSDVAAAEAATDEGDVATHEETGDAAAADTESADATPKGGCADTLLCDDFESPKSGGAPGPQWTVKSLDCAGTGTLAIDSTIAHGGKQSLLVKGRGGYCNHVFIQSSAIASATTDVYARFFVRVESALGAGHTTFLAMTDANDGNKHVRMGGQNAVLMYNRESDDATLPVMSPAGTAMSKPLAPATWTCVELHVDQKAGTLETWIDGVAVSGLAENGTPVADVSTQWLSRAWKPSLTTFALGWESYAGQDMDLRFDDVALAGHRIGCGG